MGSDRTYNEQWDDYRKRSTIFWVVFLTYLPGVLLIGGGLSKLFGSKTPIGATAFVWMVAFVITHFNRIGWECPRCGKSFFVKAWYGNAFARKCVHCGLQKWASHP